MAVITKPLPALEKYGSSLSAELRALVKTIKANKINIKRRKKILLDFWQTFKISRNFCNNNRCLNGCIKWLYTVRWPRKEFFQKFVLRKLFVY